MPTPFLFSTRSAEHDTWRYNWRHWFLQVSTLLNAYALTRFARVSARHDCPDTCGVITEGQGRPRCKPFAPIPNTDRQRLALTPKGSGRIFDHVYHPDRLAFPLRSHCHKGGGQWKRITWRPRAAEIAVAGKAIIGRNSARGEAITPLS